MPEPLQFDSLNTSFVNLTALIRYLRDQGFHGRLHVALDQYDADVFLYGADTPSVWETDRAAERESHGEAAMQRLLVRAREPGGVITVFQEEPATSTPEESASEHFTITEIERDQLEKFDTELGALVSVSQDIIAAVERTVNNAGKSFTDSFYQARVEIGDDYPFLDPTVGGFEYENSKVNLQAKPAPTTYSQGVAETLNRVVNRIAREQDETRFRELVAVELAMTVRRLPNGAGGFSNQLDRIAGTKVL